MADREPTVARNLDGYGDLVQLVAWIGALANTYLVADKTWFAIVLAGGLFGFFFGLIGFAAMIAYVIAGPDGYALAGPAGIRPEMVYADCDLSLARSKANGPRNDVHADRRLDLYAP